MTQEEKAKAYDEALERARDYWETDNDNTLDIKAKGTMEYLFPELKELEDENIKSCIGMCLTDACEQRFRDYNTSLKDCLAWLEKQGNSNKEYWRGYREGKKEILDKYSELEKQDRKKPVDKVEPKFKKGDLIVNDYCMGKVIELTDDAYLLDTGQGIPFSCEHNAHLWTIEDAKDGDVLYARGNYFKEYIFMFSSFTEDNVISTHFGYDVFHETFDTKLSRFGRKEDFISVIPATKEQRDLLFKKMEEGGYEWDAENKELKKKSQRMISAEAKEAMYDKPAWSYEDEANLNNIIWLCNNCINGSETTWIPSQATKIKHLIEAIKERGLPQQKPAWSEEEEVKINRIVAFLENLNVADNDIILKDAVWLKSLKDRVQPQNTWKPSDEQIESIRLARSFVTDDFGDNPTLSEILIELEKQLKKLKE